MLDFELQALIRAHYRAIGAVGWTLDEFDELAKELRCSRVTLAYICGHPYQGGGKVGSPDKWGAKGVPAAVCLTATVIRQFVNFKKTGVLGPPVIPLDAVVLTDKEACLYKPNQI